MANWSRLGSRGNVEDRRGLAPTSIGGIGIPGVAIVLLVSVLTGTDPTALLSQLESIPLQTQTEVVDPAYRGQDEYEVFASTVLGSNNAVWEEAFQKQNKTYEAPRLVLFRTATSSACGTATSAIGPHYCLLDSTIYLDETFF